MTLADAGVALALVAAGLQSRRAQLMRELSGGHDIMTLKPGQTGTATLVVGAEHTAEHFGSGRAPVLATPMMVALMEAAAVDCIERSLPEGQESLGIRIDVEHIAATPLGLTVTATAELAGVNGRAMTFSLEARDERELIGRGTHTRVAVDVARFRAKVQSKVKSES